MPRFSRQQVIAIVTQAIRESLRTSGRPVPDEILGTTKIIGGVEGFDSPDGVDVTTDLELQLEIEIEGNVFVKTVNGHPRARNLSEVVDILCKILGTKE